MIGGGLVALMVAGDALVRGASALALRLGIPALIVSLTIVAFGTSAPELLVSVESVIGGAPGLALGNIVGSNIANVLLVLGLPALITTMRNGTADTRQSYLQMLAATLLLIGLLWIGPLQWWGGLICLAGLAAMIGAAIRSGMRDRAATLAAEEAAHVVQMAPAAIGALLVLGLVGLPVGAAFLVDGSTGVARAWGVSDTVIGLTIVALGTSLPELATTVIAALRRQTEVALGNVIGSNLFNILGILGLASLFGDIPADPGFFSRDLWVMLASALVLVPVVFFRTNLTRRWGVGLIGAYALYLWTLI